jgi:hypothetical protein
MSVAVSRHQTTILPRTGEADPLLRRRISDPLVPFIGPVEFPGLHFRHRCGMCRAPRTRR